MTYAEDPGDETQSSPGKEVAHNSPDLGAYISIPRVTLSPSVTEWKKERDLTTELEPSKERSEALEVFRKIPEVSKWIELTVKGGRFEVDATGKATWS